LENEKLIAPELLKEIIAILAWRANYPLNKLSELVVPAQNNLKMRGKNELPPLTF
jgi:hypothetical protein